MDEIGDKIYRGCTWHVSKGNFAYSVVVFKIKKNEEYKPIHHSMFLLSHGEPKENEIHREIDEHVFNEWQS